MHAGRSLGGQHLPGAMGVWGLTVQRPGRRGVGVRQPHSALAGAGVPPGVRARENLQKHNARYRAPATRNVLSLALPFTRDDTACCSACCSACCFQHLPPSLRVPTRKEVA
jgi:hypothetical protein